ncbi:MAG: hypothetical protein HY817_04940 [Candidatus Abawacabacteria bacterium]|nr:hypothetical protein [Candidatus Abawacabacteria bacterium]
MEIIYLPRTVFGEVFYEPQSRDAIAFTPEDEVMVMTMAPEFDPMRQKDPRRFELTCRETFRELIDAIQTAHRAKRLIRDALNRSLER